MRVRIPEVEVGPPLARWRGPRVVDVAPEEVAARLAQGGELIDSAPAPTGKAEKVPGAGKKDKK